MKPIHIFSFSAYLISLILTVLLMFIFPQNKGLWLLFYLGYCFSAGLYHTFYECNFDIEKEVKHD